SLKGPRKAIERKAVEPDVEQTGMQRCAGQQPPMFAVQQIRLLIKTGRNDRGLDPARKFCEKDARVESDNYDRVVRRTGPENSLAPVRPFELLWFFGTNFVVPIIE